MSRSSARHGATCTTEKKKNKFKGVRRRKWGKWVSEIRVPGSQERLWLGTYSTPEAAAVAHDVAVYCLRRPSSLEKLNFPETLPSYCAQQRDMSPRSVQRVASDAGMAVDAQNIIAGKASMVEQEDQTCEDDQKEKTADHRHSSSTTVTVCCNGAAPEDDSDVFWWEGLGDDCGAWHGSEGYREGEALSISIEDYL